MEAKIGGRWFAVGVVVGITWSALSTISIQRLGNGAWWIAMVAILPIIGLERWFVVRGKQATRGPARTMPASRPPQ
jgi:hypothetical protein